MVTYFLGGGKPFEAHVLITVARSARGLVSDALQRYPVSSLPETEEELTQWLYKVYEAKDKALGTFKTTGSFDAPREPYRDLRCRLEASLYPLIRLQH